MSYSPHYSGGWQSGESGATPITPEALAHMEAGIAGAYKKGFLVDLIDNGNFRNPINQRGLHLYEAGSIRYTLDRWRAMSGIKVTMFSGSADSDGNIGPGCVNLENTSATSTYGFAQYLAAEKTPAVGSPITIVFRTSDGTVYIGTSEMPSSGRVNIVTVSGTVTVQIYAASEGARVTFLIAAGGRVYLEWVHLFIGTFTAATVPDCIQKDYSTELAECKRYYTQISAGSANMIVGIGEAASEAELYVSFNLGASMRQTPSVGDASGLAVGSVSASGNNVTAAEVHAYDANSGLITLKITVDNTQTVLTAGNTYSLVLLAGASIPFSADL